MMNKETAWEMFRRLYQIGRGELIRRIAEKLKLKPYQYSYVEQILLRKSEPEAIRIMTAIERELKNE